MNLIRVIRILLARKWLLITGPIGAMALAVLLTAQQPPTYTASAMIQLSVVNRTSGPSLPGEHNRFDRYAVQTTIGNLLTLLKSRSVAIDAGQRVFQTELDALAAEEPVTMPDGRTHPNPLIEVIAGYDEAQAAPLQQALQAQQQEDELVVAFMDWVEHHKRSPFGPRAVSGGLSVRRSGDGDIITLKFSAEDPASASLMLEAIIDAFSDAYAVSQSENFSTARAFFEEQVAAARGRLDDKEAALKSFTQDNGISNYIDQTRALAQHIETVKLLIEQAAQAEAGSRAEMDAVAKLLGGDAVAVAAVEAARNDSELLALEAEVAATQSRTWMAKALTATDGALQPAPQSAIDRSAQIATHFAQRQTGLGTHRADMVRAWAEHRVNYKGALAGREALEGYLTQMADENNRYARLGSEFSRLERDINVAEREYLELLDSLNTARLYERQMDTSAALTILDAVQVPREPEPAGRTMIVLLAGIITGVLLVSVVLLVAYFDRSLQEIEDFERETGLPVLGGLPTARNLNTRPTDPDLKEQTVFGRLLSRTDAMLRQQLSEDEHAILLVGMRPDSGKTTLTRLLALNAEARAQLCLDPDEPVDESVPMPELPAPGEVVYYDSEDLSVASTALREAQGADRIVLILPTGMIWREADRRNLEALRAVEAPIAGVVVNHMSYHSAEALLGEIPKPRSFVRRAVHQLLELRLRSAPRWIPADEGAAPAKAKKK